MASFIRNPKDFWSGAIFIGFGLAAVLIGRDYSMGTAGRMGPAYFPTILGSMLVVLGAIGIVRSMFRQGEAITGFTLKGMFLVIGATVLFGFLVRGAGLPIAIILMVMLSGLASIKFKVASYLMVAVGMAIFCSLVFVKGLGLPMPIIGNWFGI
ncbi:tripartite tricarboxylate transporter TctB family protein [Noviherbaspirillum sp. CPCC 100848]|uniref:Tripartite tricarboxylate transporter TctB family protein n=1 Tax=Noviherbaspirillum album TaxID=3080276 RepID=A0ABU6J9R5_9BURK|nr:tripartite tricarboxylate transporter TctB family protein [Noviherbaspirillum sp. CPCC 100848]MEC4720168.1 tripartite tricarboxylate transporter TctB family protein [Noviherbaspirillum sp. CPCC 100848]